MDDAWQSQDMAPSNGGIGIPSHGDAHGNNGAAGDDAQQQWNGGGRSPMRVERQEPPRRSSRSRSPGRRDDERDRERGPPGGGRDNREPRGDNSNSNPGNNLHVSGLSTKVDTRELEAAFAKVGRVQKASVMYDPHTRDSRGFGFVTMETAEEADAAIVALNSTDFMGKVMTVEKARRARARTPTPGRYYGPPKRFEYERPYDPRPYDSRYSRDYDDRRDRRRYDDYPPRRYDDRRDDYRERERGDRGGERYREERRYDDRRY
ncbi:RNA-binding domain-containing protein [Ephemerocybe angulata]|uniref:RNA-binding domain-containing protein n=1 Tax=Ephemerocybe angulata TaxID=980116 RepID=A0A8H6M3L0_9AGAR|nr:RNA-binding domain-containing protein [Tulosesus angulatus]